MKMFEWIQWELNSFCNEVQLYSIKSSHKMLLKLLTNIQAYKNHKPMTSRNKLKQDHFEIPCLPCNSIYIAGIQVYSLLVLSMYQCQESTFWNGGFQSTRIE